MWDNDGGSGLERTLYILADFSLEREVILGDFANSIVPIGSSQFYLNVLLYCLYSSLTIYSIFHPDSVFLYSFYCF